MQKKTNQGDSSVTIVKDYTGNTVKYGKVQTEDRKMSTYEKAMDAMKTPTMKVEGKVKKKGKAVTKSNAKGTLGSKNSRKRN